MKKILFAVIISLTLFSCKEFLEPKSENQYIPENVESLYEVLIGNIYPGADSNKDYFHYNGFLSDDVSTIKITEGDFPETTRSSVYSKKKVYCQHPGMFEPFVDDIEPILFNTWQLHYTTLKSCNAILDYIETVENTNPELKMRVLAEAHFFRAFYYFNLVNLFAKPYNADPNAPGVPLKLTSGFNPNLMPRNSVKEVYTQIIKDLDLSESYYAKFANGEYFSQVSRPSIYLLYLFRSRVALYMENWEDAKKYSEKVIYSKKGFALHNLNSFVPDATTSRYPSYTNAVNPNSETIYTYGNASGVSENLHSVEIPKMTGINQTNSPLSLRYYVAAPELMSLFQDGDLRKKYYSVLEYCNTKPMVGELEGFHKPFGKVNVSNTNAFIIGNKNFGYSFRLSEAYLTYAEACAKLNKSSEAIAKMSELLSKRFVAGSSNVIVPALSGEELVEYVRTQRRLELCFEGHRWFDQRRYGMKAYVKLWHEKGVVVHKIQMNDNDPAFTIKIPYDVRINNNKLVQNTDWEKKY